MQRLTAYISGQVQKAGYRARVIDIARSLGIRGYIKNLEDGRVMVVAEGKESDLEEFAQALVIKNTLIDVTGIDAHYSAPTGEYDDFQKMVGEGETDSRLDSAVDQLKVLIVLTRAGLDKQDQMLGLMGQMLGKQEHTLGKQDDLIEKMDDLIEKMDETKNEIAGEIRQLRSDLKPTIEDRLSRIESDVAQIKAKVGL